MRKFMKKISALFGKKKSALFGKKKSADEFHESLHSMDDMSNSSMGHDEKLLQPMHEEELFPEVVEDACYRYDHESEPLTKKAAKKIKKGYPRLESLHEKKMSPFTKKKKKKKSVPGLDKKKSI